MVISRTPYRISFFGGGTDYPAWYREHGGAVLATAIDKYCYLTCRYLPPFFEHRLRLVYSKIESCQSPAEVQHPVVRAVLGMLNFERGLEIHHDGDLPARSGMGSSSSFTVGFLHAMYGLLGRLVSKGQLATEAIHVEQDLLGETVGAQDQILAAFGGLNFIEFKRDDSFRLEPLPVARDRLEHLNRSLMLFYTGLRRTASDVAASYVTDIGARSKQLTRMREMVDEGVKILTGTESLDSFGDLLHEAWRLKRSLSGVVSNTQVDEIYEEARRGGARGGKLLGAGGGGFVLFYVPPESREQVRVRLKDFLWVPFELDSGGSQIIFYDPERDYAELDRARAQEPSRAFREAFAEAGKALTTDGHG
ncbi:MAG: kinase [Verrucomicrobia bacterium]|nr:MAG: kinase [Verrucomicrobiota bacterium]